MANFASWCTSTIEDVGTWELRILKAQPAQLTTGVVSVSKSIPEHYAAPNRVAHVLRTLGKDKAAAFVCCGLIC